MRFLFRVVFGVVLLGVCGLAVAGFVARESLVRQWKIYRIGDAADYDEACRGIDWFETGSDREGRISALVRKWGAGNPRFDLFLARYVDSPRSSEWLRKRFSLELAWREGLLARWAQYWCWRTKQELSRQLEEILDYTELLDRAQEPLKEISWREILDLQAVFQLTGQPRWAERLTPANWHDRYHQWLASRPTPLPDIRRPSKPFFDWQGPVPP